jgi:2-oxoglutarate ferredoxin oxidoreductase subunit alpha
VADLKPIAGEEKAFMTGNEVVAWAALAAGADFMYGYPITPQNEIMHYWTRISPQYNRGFLQTEDEISAGFSTIGGVLGGAKAFTATGGPGNVLMQEPFSLAESNRLPIVAVIMQRGGPSTGTVIYSQQEVILTTHGGNGEGTRIVYSVASHQELFDYTIKSFNAAWKYRFPTFVLGDGFQAKMREPLVMYDPAARGIVMEPTEKILGAPGTPGVDRAPKHLRNCYNMEEELFELVTDMIRDFDAISPEIVEHEEYLTEDAEILIIAHGITTRAAKEASDVLREEGIKIGVFRPITLRPFPEEELKKAVAKAKQILIIESAQGQLFKLVKQALYNTPSIVTDALLKPGVCIDPESVIAKVREVIE